jgi:hypothetical protein
MPDAPKILLNNVYGWFVRVERGIYTLSEGGKAALVQWEAHLPAAAASGKAAESTTPPLAPALP